MPPDLEDLLEQRLGRVHARQRLGIERDYEARMFGHGINFFHIENWYSVYAIIRYALVLGGVYRRGMRNAAKVHVIDNPIRSARLPAAFDGYRILQISDLHADISRDAMRHLDAHLESLDYDLCVLTGDYRGLTCGPFSEAMSLMARTCQRLRGSVYGVLGNHDSIRMVPALEAMGVRMLLNETQRIERSGQCIYLSGIDDAHYYRADNIEKAASSVPQDAFAILLSHTPEVYRQAAHAGFDVMLSGHTHGGQICLPGRLPLKLNAVIPRHLGAGAWRYQTMAGYTSRGVGTSIVPVRLNCPAEITRHILHRDAQ
jgi:predicted MPP superfamily phosphohydrolase